MQRLLKLLTGLPVVVLLSLTLGGCASVSVQPQSEADVADAAKVHRPERIVVGAFTFPTSARVRVDREGAELAAFRVKLQESLQQALVTELRRMSIDAVAGKAGQDDAATPRLPGKPREPDWVIEGQFTRVNQGSRALRVALGLGAGGTKMETSVQVFDRSAPSKTPVLAFRTTGGSNAEPGLIASAGTGPVDIAVGAAITAVGSSLHGVTEDTRRTARMITAYLSEDLARRGYLDPAKVRRAKRLGTGSSKADPASAR